MAQKPMAVRTRIAPSPTGAPHLGTAYIALFNWVFARSQSGACILRIEDTDQTRSQSRYETALLDEFRWLGLECDEGPYRQSERTALYQQYAEQLVEAGAAFYCFETVEAQQKRHQKKASGRPTRYPETMLSVQEAKTRQANGESCTIRLCVPATGSIEVQDLLRGSVQFEWAQMDQQILLKSDGTATYHLANVVDDHLMEISHVIRGEEWLSSTPKHLALYKAFGWEAPVFCHMPLIRQADGAKMSKRTQTLGIAFYRRMGYIPEALLNYLARLGWSFQDDRERFGLDELIEAFDLQRISLSSPRFDGDKLKSLNGRWIRETLTPETAIQRCMAWGLNTQTIQPLLPHLLPRVQLMSDFVPMISFLFSGLLNPRIEQFQHAKLSQQNIADYLQMGCWLFESLASFDAKQIQSGLFELAAACEQKPKHFLFGFFIAITGQPVSCSLFVSMEIVGQVMCCARLQQAIDCLGRHSESELTALRTRMLSGTERVRTNS